MSVFLINAFFLCAFAFHVIYASRNKRFFLFSPFVLPFIIFTVYYLLPATVGALLVKDERVVQLHHVLYAAGIASFIAGVFISGKIISLKSARPFELGFAAGKKIPLTLIMAAGLGLLVIYGLWSGVTTGLLSGADVEELRRKAEIGKGFIKEPGLYFASLSCLLLAGSYISPRKWGVFGLRGFAMLLFLCSVIFFTVSHKTATLLPVLIFMGLVNKYRQISVFKMFIAGVLMIITIGLINVVRAGFQEDSMKSDLALKSMAVLYIYEANYVPIVKKVDKGSMELQYGNEYLQSAILFVPRFLYPEKPVSFDYFLKEKLGRTFKGGGLPPTPVGSLFLNFGFPGVIMGMLTIGFLYNMLFSMYRRESYSKAVISLYLMYYIMNPSQFFGNLSLLAIFVIFIFLTSTIMRQSVGSGSAAVPGAGEPAR